MNWILLLIFFLSPVLLIVLSFKFPIIEKIGLVLFSYAIGIFLGTFHLVPEGAAETVNFLTEVTVALALPFLLFTLNVRHWLKTAGKAMASLALAVLSVAIVVAIGNIIMLFLGRTDGWQLSGLSLGVYTGGTPNLAAIKAALSVDPAVFIKFHSYDVVLGMIYLVFLMTIAQRLFDKFLKKSATRKTVHDAESFSSKSMHNEDLELYKFIFVPKKILSAILLFVLALAVVGLSLYLSSLLPKSFETAAVILMITTFSILLSFFKTIHSESHSFSIGMYFIYVFSIAVGSLTDFDVLIHIDWQILFFVSLSMFGSMALHSLFSKIFRIDTDTFIITSTAAICSPPFVPVVAERLRNREVLLSGLTTGIIGYAIGNYLGITIALILQMLLY